jgi:CheY-like chemotaxis protein
MSPATLGGTLHLMLPATTTNIMSTPRSLHILVVDDHHTTATTMGKLLEARGHTAVVTFDGQDALAAIQQSPPHVALLDVHMPGMDGHELTRRIRVQPGGQSIVVIVISGDGHPDTAAKSRQAGANHHFVKPVDYDQLWRILEDAAQEAFGP